MAQQSAKQRKVVHADIKLNNKPELATRFLDVPNMPWEATKFPGIQIKGDLSGRKAFFNSSKAERILGWKHDL